MTEWAPLSDDWLKDFIADSNPISPANQYDDFEPELAMVSPTQSAEPFPEVTSQGDWLSCLLQDLPEVPKNSPESHQEYGMLDTVFETKGSKTESGSIDIDTSANNFDTSANNFDTSASNFDTSTKNFDTSTNNFEKESVRIDLSSIDTLKGSESKDLKSIDTLKGSDSKDLIDFSKDLLISSKDSDSKISHSKQFPQNHLDGALSESLEESLNLHAKNDQNSTPMTILRRPSSRVNKNHDLFFHKVNEKLHMLKENNCLTPRALETVFNTKDVLKECNLGRCSKHKGEFRPRNKRSKRCRSSSKPNNASAHIHPKSQLPETPMSIDFFEQLPSCKPCDNFDPPFSLSPPYSSAGSPGTCSISEPLNLRSSCNVSMNSEETFP